MESLFVIWIQRVVADTFNTVLRLVRGTILLVQATVPQASVAGRDSLMVEVAAGVDLRIRSGGSEVVISSRVLIAGWRSQEVSADHVVFRWLMSARVEITYLILIDKSLTVDGYIGAPSGRPVAVGHGADSDSYIHILVSTK